MSDYLVDFHLPGESLAPNGQEFHDQRLSSFGRADIGLALQNLGVGVSYSRTGAYDIDGQANLECARFEPSEAGIAVYVTPVTVASDGVHAVHNIAKTIDKGLPEVNPPVVRRLARDKGLSNSLFDKAEVGKSWSLWTPGESLADILDGIPGDKVVIKPLDGRQSRNVHIRTKKALMAEDTLRAYKDGAWIIEEKLDFSPKMPAIGRDGKERAKLINANDTKLPKELRAYSFGRAQGELVMSYVARIGVPGKDTLEVAEWVYLDPAAIPIDVQHKSKDVFRLLEGASGQTQMCAAIDWAYVLKSGSSEAQWIGMEINGSAPVLISPKVDRDVGGEHTALIAQLLHRVAVQGGTK